MNENRAMAKEWLEKANHDLGSAKLIFLHLPDYFDTIAFHCQQAVEKYLKALLVFSNIEFRYSHNLIYLLDLLSETVEINEERYNMAILLNGFSVQIRYPDNSIYLSKEELETAIEISHHFKDFAIQLIEE
jgi:HEPN domain-containing protein